MARLTKDLILYISFQLAFAISAFVSNTHPTYQLRFFYHEFDTDLKKGKVIPLQSRCGPEGG